MEVAGGAATTWRLRLMCGRKNGSDPKQPSAVPNGEQPARLTRANASVGGPRWGKRNAQSGGAVPVRMDYRAPAQAKVPHENHSLGNGPVHRRRRERPGRKREVGRGCGASKWPLAASLQTRAYAHSDDDLCPCPPARSPAPCQNATRTTNPNANVINWLSSTSRDASLVLHPITASWIAAKRSGAS